MKEEIYLLSAIFFILSEKPEIFLLQPKSCISASLQSAAQYKNLKQILTLSFLKEVPEVFF